MSDIKNISELSVRLSETFIDIAAIVWGIKQDDPEQFKRIWVESPLGKRHTFALAAIGRMMQEFDLDRGRLAKVGWTKAEMIASRLKPETMESLLSSAERLNARELRRLLRGETAVKPKILVFELTPSQYDAVLKTLLHHGAKKGPGGLKNKEQALHMACSSLNLKNRLAELSRK